MGGVSAGLEKVSGGRVRRMRMVRGEEGREEGGGSGLGSRSAHQAEWASILEIRLMFNVGRRGVN